MKPQNLVPSAGLEEAASLAAAFSPLLAWKVCRCRGAVAAVITNGSIRNAPLCQQATNQTKGMTANMTHIDDKPYYKNRRSPFTASPSIYARRDQQGTTPRRISKSLDGRDEILEDTENTKIMNMELRSWMERFLMPGIRKR